MKKLFTYLILATSMLLVFSHCKKEDHGPAGDLAEITAFSLQGINATFSIDPANGDITHNGVLPMGTNVTSLVADFQFSPGAYVYVNGVEQVSGVTPNNFSNKVIYYVLSGNKSTAREYDVYVVVEGGPGSSNAMITSFSIPSVGLNFTINESAGTITHASELPMGTDVTALVPEFTFSNGATVQVNGVDQESGVTANDFTSPVVYSVTSSDMSLTTDYTVTVKVMGATSDPEWNSLTPDAGFLPFQDQRAGILNGEVYVMGTASVAVGGPNFQQVWKSSDGVTWGQVTTTPDVFPPYGFFELLTLNNDFHMIGGATLPDFNSGGSTFQAVAQDAVSTSSDGAAWTETTGAGFAARVLYRGANFNNQLFIVGGNSLGFGTPNAASTDVYRSSNGVDWSLVTSTPGFDARSTPAVFVHDGKLWVTGGGGVSLPGPEDLYNDVWYTEDGSSWTQVAVTSPYPARTGHNAISYNGNMYVFFGNDNEIDLANKTFYGDIWMSEDNGVTWSEVTGDAAMPGGFMKRGSASILVDSENKIWIIGGINNSGPLKDVWRGNF